MFKLFEALKTLGQSTIVHLNPHTQKLLWQKRLNIRYQHTERSLSGTYLTQMTIIRHSTNLIWTVHWINAMYNRFIAVYLSVMIANDDIYAQLSMIKILSGY